MYSKIQIDELLSFDDIIKSYNTYSFWQSPRYEIQDTYGHIELLEKENFNIDFIPTDKTLEVARNYPLGSKFITCIKFIEHADGRTLVIGQNEAGGSMYFTFDFWICYIKTDTLPKINGGKL